MICMFQKPEVNLFSVFKLAKIFIFACCLLIHNESVAAKNLRSEGNISSQNFQLPCRYRCPKMDSIILDYMNDGSKFFLADSIQYALTYYFRAVKLSPKNVDILENLAECYSKLGYHYRALDEANYILRHEPPYCFQGVYYKAKALSGLQRYTEAIKFVTTQMSINPELRKSGDLLNLLTKLRKLEYQQRTGNYDILKLYKNDWVSEDYADYIGSVEITEIPGKGLGTIATADIRAGQLLLVNKAFAIVYQEDLEDSQWLGLHELVEAVATKLEVEPEHLNWFYKVYAGPEMSYSIPSGNSSMDYRRIHQVCSYTSTAAIMYPAIDTEIRKRGLWILPSYINHNGFDSNSFWVIHGDIIILRAFKNITKGEEISVTYTDPAETFEQRDANSKVHGFECSCSLCQADRNDSLQVRKKRDWISSQFNTQSLSPTMMESYVKQLERLRPNNPELNVYIMSPLKRIAEDYYYKGQYEKAAEHLIKAHKIAKNMPLATIAVEFSTEILNSYIAMGNHEKILKWINTVKEDLITAYGSADIYKVIGHFTYTLMSLTQMGITF